MRETNFESTCHRFCKICQILKPRVQMNLPTSNDDNLGNESHVARGRPAGFLRVPRTLVALWAVLGQKL